MACRCGSKKHEANYINKETMELVSKTHFSESEINELRNRFDIFSFRSLRYNYIGFTKFQTQTKDSASKISRKIWGFLGLILPFCYLKEFFI